MKKHMDATTRTVAASRPARPFCFATASRSAPPRTAFPPATASTRRSGPDLARRLVESLLAHSRR